jgi:hypothetical protein
MSKKKLNALKSQLRILQDWKITYQCASKYGAQCSIHPRNKRSIIYGWGTKTKEPKDFLIHELLHSALRALTRMDKRKIKELRMAEEELVQDICRLILKGV